MSDVTSVELREFFEKVMSRYYEYHPDEFGTDYEKFTSTPPPPTRVDTPTTLPEAPSPVTNG